MLHCTSPWPAGIRLAGATNDVHIMDVRSGKWEKVTPQGEPPSPRAAHAAAAVGNMVVVQGGIGPAGLASEDLHVLDFTDLDKPRWHRCVLLHAACCLLLGVAARACLVGAGHRQHWGSMLCSRPAAQHHLTSLA